MTTRIRITKTRDGDAIAEQMVDSMANLGQAIGRRMQRLVPKRTWALHDTISAETERRGSRITTTIGFGSDDVDYGLAVERGTSRMRAQPFARPALLQSKASDLEFSGSITRHGVNAASTSRSRRRSRSRRSR